MNRPPIEAVALVVPVHDEEELLERCLGALARVVERSDVPCVVRIVLDACRDDSARIAARSPFPVVSIDANAVGAARRRGVEAALADCSGIDPAAIWIATTDADSVVPDTWLDIHLAAAAQGADVVLGTVRPDFDDLTPRHRRHWLDTHPRGRPAGNTHGANLGVRAAMYLRVGGFADVAEHEDVGLVEACRRAGAAIAVSDDAEVMTSGRFEGRTPGGYAAFLRTLSARLAGGDRTIHGPLTGGAEHGGGDIRCLH